MAGTTTLLFSLEVSYAGTGRESILPIFDLVLSDFPASHSKTSSKNGRPPASYSKRSIVLPPALDLGAGFGQAGEHLLGMTILGAAVSGRQARHPSQQLHDRVRVGGDSGQEARRSYQLIVRPFFCRTPSCHLALIGRPRCRFAGGAGPPSARFGGGDGIETGDVRCQFAGVARWMSRCGRRWWRCCRACAGSPMA